MSVLDPLHMYRLPWSLTDNPIAWLEPTQACNLACDGCYRQNVKAHKSMEEVEADLATFARLRNVDGYSIAGGDPLLHPEVVQIVSRVTAMGRKAIINTNGLGLTRELLRELKKAGLVGLTFHVDSHQGRPGWRNKTEAEMNLLRQEYADLVADEGGLACAFNSTVYEDTLQQVPDVLRWAARNIDRVHTVVFILYRAARLDTFEYWAGGTKAEMGEIVYTLEDQRRRTDLQAREVIEVIARDEPSYRPAAYLAGTVDPNSFKWLIAMRVGDGERIHGYLGPKLMEAVQVGHHLWSGRYLGYASPWALGAGRAAMLGSAPFDESAREAAGAWLRTTLAHPWTALRRQHMQSVLIIQPIDLGADGRDNMCDGCPDMTVHEGKLVWSCRLEEWRRFGQPLRAVPMDRPVPGPAS
ncbi:MAG TPA: radical SAM protein [Myxococcaceae bacterium]|nr:radical SAM protein [Myxococcaceae bacterium]